MVELAVQFVGFFKVMIARLPIQQPGRISLNNQREKQIIT
jgi:hypothetical protein